MPSTYQLVKVRRMIRMLKNREITPRPRGGKLFEDLRKDLHILAIEAEGLIAFGLKKRRSLRGVRPNKAAP